MGGPVHARKQDPVALGVPCPGSLRPANGPRPGDTVTCEICGQSVRVTLATADGAFDPWNGTTSPRVEAHASTALRNG